MNFEHRFSEHPALTRPCSLAAPVRHEVKHLIDTTGPPCVSRTRRLSRERLAIAKREFEHMFELGIIRPSPRGWTSPLRRVPKKGSGDWRPWWDHRAIYSITVPDRYPLPYLQDLTVLGGHDCIFEDRSCKGQLPDSGRTRRHSQH